MMGVQLITGVGVSPLLFLERERESHRSLRTCCGPPGALEASRVVWLDVLKANRPIALTSSR
jgi:hypothetical protein